MNKRIITIAVCLSFVINSVMFTWSITRRPADDLVKIKLADSSMVCEKLGGTWVTDIGQSWCRKDN